MHRVFLYSAIVICVSALNGYAQSHDDPNKSKNLDIKLAKIAAMNKGKDKDYAVLESKCLDLIKDHNSPEDKGKIYAKIAIIYSGKGYLSPNDMKIDITKKYCRKALEYPLDVINTCEMYNRLSDSFVAPYLYSSEQDFVKARQEAVQISLKGLKLVLDCNAPKELPIHPGGVGFYNIDGDPNDPAYQKAIQEVRRKQAEQIALHEKWKSEEKLYFLRQTLTERCVDLYSHKPHDVNELEKFAKDTVKNHDDVLEELMLKVRTRISQQENK